MIEVDRQTAIESLEAALRNYRSDRIGPYTLAIISQGDLLHLEMERDGYEKSLLLIRDNARSQLDGMNSMGVTDDDEGRRAASWCYAEATAALLHHQDQVQVPPGPRKRIYIAGPYTQPDPEENVRKAVFAADAVAELGFAPFVPHLSHLWEQISPKPYAFWIALDNAFLPLCDALLRIPGPSSGADGEVALALSLGIPVFHSLEALAAALQP